jgi:prepilin-type N-terminal cleavage/methylation domain-containing protein
MKKAITLIELMVTVAIIGVLYSLAVPSYDRQIFKDRFDNEAAIALKSIALAQEQYHIETGKYFPADANTKTNGDEISNELKIDLSWSNNFLYYVRGTDGQGYTIGAILRKDTWNVCPSDDENREYCLQQNTKDEYQWVKDVENRSPVHFFLEYNFNIDNKENGLNYQYIFQGE